jgi:NADH-quinone oxidoreductase subunit J
MTILFYIASTLSIITTLLVVTGKNAVHALLYLIVSLLSVSVVFFLLGAPFIAALEVIIYAGAIMVLFVFVIMMLNINESEAKIKQALLKPKLWIGPSIISFILLAEMIYVLSIQTTHPITHQDLSPAIVGELLYTKYSIIVELAAFLIIAGIVGAYHLGEKEKTIHHRYLKNENKDL